MAHIYFAYISEKLTTYDPEVFPFNAGSLDPVTQQQRDVFFRRTVLLSLSRASAYRGSKSIDRVTEHKSFQKHWSAALSSGIYLYL